MANQKYLELITPKKEEEVQLEDLKFKVRQSQLQLQSDILSSEKTLADLKKALQSQKGAYPLDASAIIGLANKVTSAEAGLKALRDLEAELF